MLAGVLWRLMMLSWGLAAAALVTQWRWLALASAAVLAVYLCLSVPAISRAGLVLLALLILLTAFVTWQSGAAALEAGLRQATVFAAFMPTARLLRTVAFHDPAIVRIRRGFRRMPADSRPGWMLFASHALSSCLSIGAFAVLAPLLPKRQDGHRLHLAQMTLLGGGLSVIWSPFFVAQAFVSHGYPAVPTWQIVLSGLAMAACGLGMAAAINRMRDIGTILSHVIPMLGTLLLPVAIVVTAVLLLNRFGGYSNIEAMVLAIPPLALFAAWFRRPRHMPALFRQAPRWVGGMAEEIGIVTLAILFSGILPYAPLHASLQQAVERIDMAPAAILLVAFLAMVLLEMIGLHPILCATLALEITHTAAGRLPDLLFAMTILLAWSFGSVMSYSGLLPSIAASTLAVPKHRLLYGRNLIFVGSAALLSCAVLTAMAL